MYYVYIIKGKEGHYVWYSWNLQKRLEQHKTWATKTTKKMGELILLWYFLKEEKTEAIKLERMIKKNGHIDHWTNHTTFIKNTG